MSTNSEDEQDDLQPAVTGFRPVRGPTVPEVVAERLREAILAGRYSKGERLVEQKLAALFSIGQPTVREALRELELQGFVRKKGNRGTYVTEFSAEDVRNHHEVRMALESLAVEKAAANLTEGDAEQLEALLKKLETAGDSFDRSGFHKLDMAFHRKVWACANNQYLAVILERVTFSLFAFQLLERKPGDPVMKHVGQQHRQMMEALLTREPAEARRIFLTATAEHWHLHEEPSAQSAFAGQSGP